MRRRLSLIVLAALFLVPAVAPVRAGEPSAPSASPEPAATEAIATPTPEAEATPDLEPTPESGPTESPPASPVASTAPESSPTVEPSREPSPDPEPSPTPTPTQTETAAPAPSQPVDEPPASAGAEPDVDETRGRPDPKGRFIVILEGDADTGDVVERLAKRKGVKAERSFEKAIRGFTARLTPAQRTALEADSSVVAVVPDEVIEVAAQTTPTGVARIGTKANPVAKIDGVDQRVDADVAIVDTGIQSNHPDLNVVGGYNCSTTSRGVWRDVQGHGTHVAGTVAALDNGTGVVGVAPGARLWAVKILNDDGYGLLSWYVCGLDWIAAQRDPADTSRPLIEAVNMSVVKNGRDDRTCGTTSNDPLHKAICRVTSTGITVVAAAGNDSSSAAGRVPAAYNEVITVSALADLDGKAGGLGGPRCWSWGGYDKDDTFADFSNFGSDVDIIAPGKCIWSSKPGSTYGYSSGTSMATPAVTGAAALYKASRPNATPAEVREALIYLGNTGWSSSTDPDTYHEKLLDVSKLSALGTFSISSDTDGYAPEGGGSVTLPVTITRSATFFERVRLGVSGVPEGWTARLATTSLLGWTAKATTLTVTVPASFPAGVYDLTITATNQGRVKTSTAQVVVGNDNPTAFPPSSAQTRTKVALNRTSASVLVAWPAATDLSSTIAGYEFQYSRDGGAWTGTTATAPTVRTALKNLVDGGWYRFRVRARDAAGNWSDWAPTDTSYRVTVYNDRNTAFRYVGTWNKVTSSSATKQTITSTDRNGASVRYTFTGRGISVVAPMSPTRAWFEIRIDGAYVGKVSLSASTLRHRQVIYSKSWATTGTHTIELRNVTSSTRRLASLDAFVVLR